MCLSTPARVIETAPPGAALVEAGGRRTTVLLTALGADADSVQPGTWLLVHSGLAVDRLSDDDAAALLRLRAEAGV